MTLDLKRRRTLLAAGLFGLLALLTWLFIQADAVSPHTHYRYQAALRNLRQADVELNAAVLASRTGLLQNYDPMVRHIQTLRQQVKAVEALPEFVGTAARARLAAKVEELAELLERKAALVDRFQRGNAVLHNSSDYFPQAADHFLHSLGAAAHSDPEYGRFIRALLAFGRAGSTGGAVSDEHLHALADRLAARVLPARERQALDHLLLHARAIIARQPEVDGLARSILELPTAARQEEIAHLYATAHEHSLAVADRYRLLLYAAAVALAFYLLWAYLRIERDAQELAATYRALIERYEAQQQAEERLRLYATVFSSASEGMTITDAASRIVAVNPAFTAITGYAEAEALGQTPALLNSGRQDAEYYRRMWDDLASRGIWRGEIWNRRKDGVVYPEWLSITAVRGADESITHYIGIFSDISERKESEQRIRHLSHHDSLTGLPNRLLLDDRLNQAMLKSRREGRSAAVLFLDLDRFKNINETLGHASGDELLVQAVKRSLAVLRETDTLSRHGGDEFIVVLPDLEQPQDAAVVARKLLQTLGLPYELAGHALTITASIGIALHPDDGATASDLLRNAETAMYRAKEEGRNTLRFYSADMDFASLGDLLLEAHLRSALDRGELLLYYQPKIDARDGRLIGAEALMRWNHPEQGMIAPSLFIPLAEECGLINSLGEWALHRVCAQQRQWLDAGLAAVPVAVNVSARQFTHQDVPAVVAAALTENRLPPELLELELTESLLMHDADHAAAVLGNLRGMRISLAIDDFGTGFSSLSYLQHLPVQALKIDKSFVQDIGTDGEAVRLAAAIIALAHSMELYVIAEGVETEAQRDYLARHGCDQFQGYYFDRPLPEEEFAARLSRL